MDDRSTDAALAAALKRAPPRAVQVISRCLLERRGLTECAAFYGISGEAFAQLLTRSLRELEGVGVPSAPAASPPLHPPDELLAALPPGDASLRALAVRLWAAGRRALIASQDEAEDGWSGRLWRVAILAALIGSLVYAAMALS